ncbi:MAG: hypothetical protein GKR89_18955 [Candidatus Latescibacteria bacterium]|nr:hypothetical protein [Candidatus Latescibacterota bacterium]
MPATLTMLHTAPTLAPLFEELVRQHDPHIAVRHIVDESLLQEARQNGITPQLRQRIQEQILQAANDQAGGVLCTCSSIGGPAEEADALTAVPVIRVDRPMAARAVSLGQRVIIAAALASTIEPTRDLVLDAARQAGKDIDIVEVACTQAWERFEQGDRPGYWQAIAQDLRQNAHRGDVIVLAQASMAGAADLCSDISIPVLSSPALGIEAAVALYRSQAG